MARRRGGAALVPAECWSGLFPGPVLLCQGHKNARWPCPRKVCRLYPDGLASRPKNGYWNILHLRVFSVYFDGLGDEVGWLPSNAHGAAFQPRRMKRLLQGNHGVLRKQAFRVSKLSGSLCSALILAVGRGMRKPLDRTALDRTFWALRLIFSFVPGIKRFPSGDLRGNQLGL